MQAAARPIFESFERQLRPDAIASRSPPTGPPVSSTVPRDRLPCESHGPNLRAPRVTAERAHGPRTEMCPSGAQRPAPLYPETVGTDEDGQATRVDADSDMDELPERRTRHALFFRRTGVAIT
jgi:hypothetical protein